MSARVPLRAVARARVALPATATAPMAPLAISAVRFASSEASSSKTQATSTDAKGKAKQTETPSKYKSKSPKNNPLPMLSRPLGVLAVPSSTPKTWEEKKRDMLDSKRHTAKRKALIKEASQGYFHDYNLAREAHGGKLWIAPPVLIREDAALYFPDIEGKALAGGTKHTTDMLAGKVTLVTILNTRISEEHVNSFVEPVLADWEGTPNFQYLQINHQANVLKSMLLSFVVSSLRRSMPENRWASYLISSGEWSDLDIAGPLGLENKLLGYVFLVDANCKVRWAGCGQATPEEVDNLRRATAVLIRRTNDVVEKGEEKVVEEVAEKGAAKE